MGKRGVFWFLTVVLSTLPLFSNIQPVKAASASYYFSPSTINLNVGQTATVTLYLSTDQAINAGDGTIVLPNAQVSGGNISKSGSIFANWPEEPSLSGSSIRFAGGLPTPGFQGSSGKVLSFTVRGTSEGTGLITLSGGRILANNANSTNIYSGASNATVNVTRVVSGASISSSTHPDPASWYKVKDAELSWTKPSGVSGYSYTLSHNGGQSSKTGNGSESSAKFTGLADGVWTFSLTTNYSDGKSATSSFRLQIDTTPPGAFTFKAEQANGATDPFPILSYSATDSPSGIDHYDIIIDNGTAISTADPTYKLPKIKPGKHSVIVRAFDKAGNSTDATGTITVEGFPGPVITNYPSIVSIFQKIKLQGTALYGAKVQLYIGSTLVEEFTVKEFVTESQKQKSDFSAATDETVVEWQYELKNGQLPGYKTIYATQSKADGAESNQSNTIRLLVAPDSISLFGLIIPMLIVVLITALLLVLLLVLLFLLYRKSRKFFSLRKDRLKELKLMIENDVLTTESNVGHQINPEETPSVFDEINRLKAEIDRDFDEVLGDSTNKGDNKK